ncbi:MAG: hypothetical protein KDH97_12185 [Calditrichaeota bacterium]|nr:hypothetical protein [Calditrichota bacterium]MCB0291006.1 hypothetical protein [Calditrichota bacterium]MCB0306024.1 hypothetical protein [Calditrichota bacterium]MCB0315599.1 hypothetical protein [Calditrichota bacterium]
MKKLLVVLLLGVMTGSCGLLDSGSDTVAVSATLSGVLIENNTSETIYHTAFSKRILPLIDWIPCTVPDDCPGVAPEHYKVLRYADIEAYSENDTVVVYWWNLQKIDDGYKVVNLERAMVDTRFYVKL